MSNMAGKGFGPEYGSGVPGQMDEYGATEPIYGGASPVGQTEPPPSNGFEAYQPTEPAGMGSSGFGVMEPTRPGMVVEDYGSGNGPAYMGETMPPIGGNGFFDPESMSSGIEEYGVTVPAAPNGIHGFTPVVGWLVCIDGPERGKDYRIHPENNFLGRAENMDICIKGDQLISREKQLTIAYVTKNRTFYIGGTGGGRNIVELNDLPLMDMKELHAYDVITVGSTKLMFVPFCGERFGWDE